jgi:uncharacterized protein
MRHIKLLMVSLLLALVAKVINELSFSVARWLYPSLAFMDPDHAWLVLTIHHIVQAMLGITIISIYIKSTRSSFKEFGFRWPIESRALKYIFSFCAIWAIIQFTAAFILVKYTNQSIVFGFPFTMGNFLSHLGFQLFLSGTSEEIIFRSMIMTILVNSFQDDYKPAVLFRLVIAIATIIFMVEHINIDYRTFTITHINYLQQLTVLIFGIFYGWLFLKYKNYWAPALAHNLLNSIIITISLILF